MILKVKEEDAEEEEAEDADNILQLLLGKEEAAEEKDDDDDEHEAELAKLAAATGHMNHGEKAKLFLKKRQHLNRSKLYRELPIFLLFMSTFLSSLFIRRQVGGWGGGGQGGTAHQQRGARAHAALRARRLLFC